MFKTARKFTDNLHLTDSLKITISSIIPFLVLMPYKEFTLAFTIAMGALLTAPVDIPSNLKHKVVGLLVGALLIPTVTFILCTVVGTFLFYPVFLTIIFALCMISVYGHRANMLSFTGLLAVSLAFVHPYQGKDLYIHCAMLLLGGILYLVVSLLFNLARPRRYAALQTSECMDLTSQYLQLRANLWAKEANRDKIIEEQLNIQVKLNEIHENLREYLVRNKANTGNSSYNRKMLVAFTALVDIQEIALSTAFDHKKLYVLFKDRLDIIEDYKKLADQFASTISNISLSLNIGKKYTAISSLTDDLKKIEDKLYQFQKDNQSYSTSEAVLMFSNVIHYAGKQIEKIKILERVLTNTVTENDLKGKHKDLEKFLTPQHYRWDTLKENMNFSSTIFRHALRLTITILVGFMIGQIFNLLNGYWILLTIVVIMRPGFGLTKQRSFERVIGTVAGGLVAFGLLAFIDNTTVLAVLTIFTMIVGYWFSHTDYKIGVTFITIYVVLIYGILTPNFMDLLTYRIIDTLIGAVLAFGANYLLWPSWEFLNLNIHLTKSIKANRDYLKEISIYYNEKGEVTLPYRLTRKYAFIEIGNLMSSFQRMIQEPKSKQKYRSELYELAVLNHTLLSSAASIGTYIQSHKTTEASKAFNVVMDTIVKNLNTTIEVIQDSSKERYIMTQDEQKEYEISFSYLKDIREKELKLSIDDDEDIKVKMEESQLVIEQLIWLTNLSEQILKVAKKLAYKKNLKKTVFAA